MFAKVQDPVSGKFTDLSDVLEKALPFIFGIAAMITTIYLVWGGLRYMTARGDPKAAESARSQITAAVIGLLIILFVATIAYFFSWFFRLDLINPTSGIAIPAYAASSEVDIGCAIKLQENLCLGQAFPTFGSFFTAVLRVLLFFGAILFFAMFIWGGFRYLNSGGNPENAESARKTLTDAGIGLLITIATFVIIEIATRLAGIPSIFIP